jgi:hypothetical protein
MHGHIDINVDIDEFKTLTYNKATIDPMFHKEYVEAGHLSDAMILYNYFEPSPMPKCVSVIKDYFNYLSPLSLAINYCKPGQYLPLHNDMYKRWMQVNSINNINNIVRAIVMLEPSQPGQIIQIENHCYTMWKQGDFVSWKGSTPHAIYNFSKHDRYAIQVTGYLNEIL